MIVSITQTTSQWRPDFHPKTTITEESTSLIKAKSEPILFAPGKTRSEYRMPKSMCNEALVKFDISSDGHESIRNQIGNKPMPLQLKSIRLMETDGFERKDATVGEKNTLKIGIINPHGGLCFDIQRSLDLRLEFDRSFDRNHDEIRLNFHADSFGFKTPRTCIVQLFPPVGIEHDEKNLTAFILREEYSHRVIVVKIVIPTAMIYNAWKMKINLSMKKNLSDKHQDHVF